MFIYWDCLQSSSHHVVRTRWGLYHFLTCGCRKSQTNHASLRDLSANCVRNCRLETTPAYSMRYLCCRKIKLRGHRICNQDTYKPVSSLVSIFRHKTVSCSESFFVIHKDNKWFMMGECKWIQEWELRVSRQWVPTFRFARLRRRIVQGCTNYPKI